MADYNPPYSLQKWILSPLPPHKHPLLLAEGLTQHEGFPLGSHVHSLYTAGWKGRRIKTKTKQTVKALYRWLMGFSVNLHLYLRITLKHYIPLLPRIYTQDSSNLILHSLLTTYFPTSLPVSLGMTSKIKSSNPFILILVSESFLSNPN